MRRLVSILMPAVGLAIFAVIVHRVGPARIGGVLSTIEPISLLWALPLIGAIALARGARWSYVMRCVGIDYGLARSTGVWMIGFFASAVTPAKAGDAIRALYVRNDTGRPMGEALLTVFVDRLWDLGFILVSGVASALLFSRYYIRIPSVPVFVAGAVLIGIAAVLMTRRGFMRAVLRPAFSALVPSRYRDGLASSFHTFYDALRVYGRNPRHALTLGALTLVCWGLIFTLAVYVSRLVGAPVSVRYVLLIMPIVTLVELIPFSISGLGTRDATVVYFFAIVGVGSAEAVGFSIAYVLIGTYLTALVGFVLWLRTPVRRAAASEER